ncbi:carbonic anhydrase [Paraliomyxa miuraensis]|uniref:carbonic anhydrase n=1 Tax=Paraliomyxa miuraensis TaxID=376150 RepID=UPI00224E171F|nr:carbonic anhydrase [Paraliomyxa miuraensis]MCX4246508.1 carbonic anhydrase [Paraliomyxa miuraensis]
MTTSVPPSDALQRLQQGNARFTSDTRSIETLVSQLRRAEQAQGQRPFAVVLTCSDSRVPVEMIFDQGIGDLFVIRVAGNVIAPSLVGSVEFAAATFGTRLVVVMGHTSCGAVKATLEFIRSGGGIPSDNIRDIVERIVPSAKSVVEAAGDRDPAEVLAHAVRANVRGSVAHLRNGSRLLEQLVSSGQVAVVGAEYDLASGQVDFFDVPNPLP